jgi:hypothetical protein
MSSNQFDATTGGGIEMILGFKLITWRYLAEGYQLTGTS